MARLMEAVVAEGTARWCEVRLAEDLAEDRVAEDLVGRMRAICLAFPEVTERPSHGAPTWFVKDKRAFVTLWADGHHDSHFPHLWCASVLEEQQELIAADPARFFRPPYVGHRGWVGVRLDAEPDWAEIAELCQDAYQVIARPASRVNRKP